MTNQRVGHQAAIIRLFHTPVGGQCFESATNSFVSYDSPNHANWTIRSRSGRSSIPETEKAFQVGSPGRAKTGAKTGSKAGSQGSFAAAIGRVPEKNEKIGTTAFAVDQFVPRIVGRNPETFGLVFAPASYRSAGAR